MTISAAYKKKKPTFKKYFQNFKRSPVQCGIINTHCLDPQGAPREQRKQKPSILSKCLTNVYKLEMA